MDATTAQFLFAAEFVTFLAGAAGVALVVLRSELVTDRRWGKVLLALGFVVLGLVAFVRGGQLVDEAADVAVDAARIAGAVAVFAGSLRWVAGRAVRHVLWIGLALVAVSVAAGELDAGLGAELLLAIGGLAVGAAVFSASRRSIAARVAASSAGTLLLVVLVLSVALSSVLSSRVENEAIGRLDDLTSNEVEDINATVNDVLLDARLAAASLSANRGDELVRVFEERSRSAVIEADLQEISTQYLSNTPLGYVTPGGTVVASYQLEAVTLVALAGSRVLEEARSNSAERTSLDVVGGTSGSLLAVAVQPIRDSRQQGAGQLVGLLIGAVPIDRDYLEIRSPAVDGTPTALAVAVRDRVLASFARQGSDPPSPSDISSIAAEAIEKNRPTPRSTAGRFLAARPLLSADGRPLAALVGSTDTSGVEEGRRELFQTLFLIALGGTLIALVLAALVGDRIGSAVRRLTVAAEGIRRGDLTVRAGMRSDDEIGVLADTFDSMVGSLEEKTEAETALRGRLEGVVAGMGEALVAVDPDGNVTDFNQAAEELIGIGSAEARGRHVDDIVMMVSDEGVDLAERMRRPSPGRSSHTGLVERVDGSQIPVAVTIGSLRGAEGELAGAVAVLRDLRREREVERMKTEFLSRVGHELRTPLTGIRGYADLLLRHNVSGAQAKQFHEEILEQSVQLLHIVERLEFHAASAANRVMPRKERLEVRAVLRAVADAKAEMAGDSHPISVKVARGVRPVNADRRLLTMAVDELVSNAVKFSPEGGRVEVTARPAPDLADFVEIAVTDRGVGMTPLQVGEVFGDFVQGDASDTRRFGGLGAGLGLVRKVAEAHGGSVKCLSVVGKGSKFSVFLPCMPIETKR